MLRAESITSGNAFAMRDWATVYSPYPNEFKNKCSVSEFAEWASFVNDNDPNGIPQGATYVLEGVIIEGDYGWVNSHFVKDGRQIYHDADQYTMNEPAEVVWTGERWENIIPPEFLAQERPCSLEQYMGLTIDLPLPAGSAIEMEHARIGITGISRNATRIVMQENQFNDPPAPGNRFYMIEVSVEYYRTGTGPTSISAWDFDLIGDNRQLYDSSCGVIPNELFAELYPGGTAQGNVCFEVADSDSGFILILRLNYEERIFLRLE